MAMVSPAETLLLQVGRQSAFHWLGGLFIGVFIPDCVLTTTFVAETKANNNGLVLLAGSQNPFYDLALPI